MFFAIAISTFIFIHGYLFWSLTRVFGSGWWQIPVGLFFLGMIGIWYFRHSWQNLAFGDSLIVGAYAWFGVAILTCLCCLIGDLLSVIFTVLEKSGVDVAFPSNARVLAAMLVGGLVLSFYAAFEARDIRRTEITIRTDALPPGSEPFRLGVATDIHLSRAIGTAHLERITTRLRDGRPDVFLSVGDLVDVNMDRRPQDAALLKGIGAPFGSFGVPGNHEYYGDVDNAMRFHARSGITLIQGTLRKVGPIWLAGLDDRTNGIWDAKAADLARRIRYLKTEDPNAFVVLLSHRPNTPVALRGLADLQISGHTHGGQIWPATILAWAFNEFIPNGRSEIIGPDGQKHEMFVSNGAGFWGPPMRFLAPPEVVLITLEPSE